MRIEENQELTTEDTEDAEEERKEFENFNLKSQIFNLRFHL
jgi:hypothetical protein